MMDVIGHEVRVGPWPRYDDRTLEPWFSANARRAGYSAKTTEQQGPRLLGNVAVAQAIGRRFARSFELARMASKRPGMADLVSGEVARRLGREQA